MRKRGKVLASKKSSRTATEGLLALAQNESKAAVIELNCETDFVSRNEIFQYLVSVTIFIFFTFSFQSALLFSCHSFSEIIPSSIFLFFYPLQALALAKQALVAENVSQPVSGLFPVGPEYLEVRS